MCLCFLSYHSQLNNATNTELSTLPSNVIREAIQDIPPPFHPETREVNLPGIAATPQCDFWNLSSYARLASRTPTFSAELRVYCYQSTKNVGSLWPSHQHHSLLPEPAILPLPRMTWWTKPLLLPLGEMCLQVTVGSGLPVAMQVRLMLLPSLMEISEEISTILGDTVKTKQAEGKLKFCWCISLLSSKGSGQNNPGTVTQGLQLMRRNQRDHIRHERNISPWLHLLFPPI